MNDIRGRRIGFFVIIAALALLVFALPVLATSGDDHQVTICHVTASAGNPYVVVTVDVAAFDGDGDNDHSLHVAKDGRIDKLWDPVDGCDDPDGGIGG